MKIKFEKSEVAAWLKSVLPENIIKGYEFVDVESIYNGLEIEFRPKPEEVKADPEP